MIPTYLGHSYRPDDRDVNRRFLDVFWEEGFAFTVDPKRQDHLSIPHLEFMMRRSACFVALAPFRASARLYRTSPYIAYEYKMAVRAKKPTLVVAETQVSGHHFDGSPVVAFHREDLDSVTRQLRSQLRSLKTQSRPHAHDGDRLLGSVGVVLPGDGVQRRAREAVEALLTEAGYKVEDFQHDLHTAPDFMEVDKHDFFVVDQGAQEVASGLYWRFVPTVRLAYQPGGGPAPALPGPFNEVSLEHAGGNTQNVIAWSSEEQLLSELRLVIDKMQRPRRQFRSRDEGIGYFQSVVRGVQGPVFVSNAASENALAGDLSRALDLNNMMFFHYQYKNPIEMGTRWEAQLFDQLHSSRVFVALITSEYGRSAECRKEMREAHELDRKGTLRILKYFLEPQSSSTDPGERLQARDLTGMSREEQVDRIVRDIDHHLVGLPDATAPAPAE